jgi:hypothetical protein
MNTIGNVLDYLSQYNDIVEVMCTNYIVHVEIMSTNKRREISRYLINNGFKYLDGGYYRRKM